MDSGTGTEDYKEVFHLSYRPDLSLGDGCRDHHITDSDSIEYVMVLSSNFMNLYDNFARYHKNPLPRSNAVRKQKKKIIF